MPIGSRNSSRRISPGCTAQPGGPSFLIFMIAFPIRPCSNEESVVIGDLDLIGIAVSPSKAHAELIVDPNAVLTFAVVAQRLQPVTGRNSQILQSSGRVKHGQLLLRGISQIGRRHSPA